MAGKNKKSEIKDAGPRNKNRTALLAVAVVIIAGLILWLENPFKERPAKISDVYLAANEAKPVAIGEMAPDFGLEALDGRTVKLSEFRGKPVIINFWATWCPDCLIEMPWFEETHRESNGSIILLGVDLQESREDMIRFVQENGITYPILLDPDRVARDMYKSMGVPTTYFVSKEGIIVDLKQGGLTKEEYQEKLRALIES
ncbi:redoxin domain-containing protein [Candidatus Woesearchaeota archaeon]|nr:redoxin domain-containing protein [Candidatus Woesearchaeota archaeon]